MNPITQDTVMTGLLLLFIQGPANVIFPAWTLPVTGSINSFIVSSGETLFPNKSVLKITTFFFLNYSKWIFK